MYENKIRMGHLNAHIKKKVEMCNKVITTNV